MASSGAKSGGAKSPMGARSPVKSIGARSPRARTDGKSTGQAKSEGAGEFFSLEAVDFGKLREEQASNPIEEDHLIMEAIQMAKSKQFDNARDVAETILHSNPGNTTALHVNASECESRQDWGEAARFFLVGMGHNATDTAMEHGFQTNVDMIRTNRPRWLERGDQNKWDDVLTFKPRPPRERTASPDEKPPWWRLGRQYEALLENPGYILDLLDTQPDPEEQRYELRRIIYENYDLLDILYAYYKADMNENWQVDKPIPGMVKHNGDEDPEEEFMTLEGFWRILKECKIVYGDVKSKMPIAVFDRVHVQGKTYLAEQTARDPGFEVTHSDPHLRKNSVSFYSLVESFARISYMRCQGSLSVRLDNLLKDFIRPNAMKKQTDRFFLDFRSPPVQEVIREPELEKTLRKIYDYFIQNYKANKPRTNIVGPQDMTMSLNHALAMLEKMEMFDPSYNTKKGVETYSKITHDSDLLPQEHPNNQNSEMIFNEFLEFIMRTARLKSANPKEPTGGVLKQFLTAEFIPKARRIIPGKI